MLDVRRPDRASVRRRMVSSLDVAIVVIGSKENRAATSSSTRVGDLAGVRLPEPLVVGTLRSPGIIDAWERVVGRDESLIDVVGT